MIRNVLLLLVILLLSSTQLFVINHWVEPGALTTFLEEHPQEKDGEDNEMESFCLKILETDSSKSNSFALNGMDGRISDMYLFSFQTTILSVPVPPPECKFS